MKTINEDRFNILTRPYSWHGKSFLGVAVFVLVGFDEEGCYLRDYKTIWDEQLSVMNEGAALDNFMPKAYPEYLVSGNAYTNHQNEKTSCMVQVDIGGLAKRLVVTGDRYWNGNVMTRPEPFTSLPLDWRHAFGGKLFELNPAGKGIDEHIVGNIKAIALPNIEDPENRICKPQDRPTPASFGPISLTHPERIAMMGTYSEDWKKYEFPGFLPDMDPEIFNMALQDQQWRDFDELPLGQGFRVWNMHPDTHCWEGTIPELRARCFLLSNKQQPEALSEIENMRASTCWLLPEIKSLMMIFHGSVETTDPEADDIKVIMGAIEQKSQFRTLEHYIQVLCNRLDPEIAADHYASPELLVSAPLLRKDEVDPEDSEINPVGVRMARFLEVQENETRKWIEGKGMNYDEIAPAFVGPPEGYFEMSEVDLRARLNKMSGDMKVQAAEMSKEAVADRPDLEQLLKQLDKDYNEEALLKNPVIEHAGPPDMSYIEALENSGQNHNAPAFSTNALAQLRKQTRSVYRYSAQYQQAVPVLTLSASELMRQEIQQRYWRDKDLTEMDLTGADLSGFNLEGADFSDSFLEGVNLQGAVLTNCNFSRAVLTRARLSQTRIENADFTEANIAKWEVNDSQLSGCQFIETISDGMAFINSRVEHSYWRNLMPEQIELRETVFHECRFDSCIISHSLICASKFTACHFEKFDWTACVYEKVSAEKTKMKDVAWSGGSLNQCEFADSTLDNLLFEEDVTITSCRFLAAKVLDCNFMNITMNDTIFTGSDLAETDFTRSRLVGCNFDFVSARGTIFHKCDLKGSSFRNANLILATLERSDLSGCDFDHATLFRTNVSKVIVDKNTRLDKAYRDQLEIYPMQRDAFSVENMDTRS
jgi:uncharacterized protein YjbI with pentapeptide repeats